MSVRLISALCAALVAIATPAGAHDYRNDDYRYNDGYHAGHGKHYRNQHRHGQQAVVWHREHHVVPRGRAYVPVRYYAYRPVAPHHHRHTYDHSRGRDNDLLYAVLALQIVDLMNDNQRDNYAWAQDRAVTAPLGETIQWNDGNARGTVTTTRDGTDSGGRYCREFQHDITVGNQTEQGYGIACRQPDGSWQIVS